MTTPAATTTTTPARAGGPARAPRNSTAAIGTRMIQMRLAAPHDSPPAGIRLTNRTTSPTTAIVATRGVSRWLRRNSARAVPNAAIWTRARTTKAGRPEREVGEPEDDGDRHEHERGRDRRPLPDPEVRFVGGVRTDVEHPGQPHRTDDEACRRSNREDSVPGGVLVLVAFPERPACAGSLGGSHR